MLNCYVFFSDPNLVGKISELVNRLHPDLNIIQLISEQQFVSEKDSMQKDLLISDYKNYQLLEMVNIQEADFEKIFILDDIDTEDDGNISYINKNFLLTSLSTQLDDFVKEKIKKDSYIPVDVSRLKIDIEYPCQIYLKNQHDDYAPIVDQSKKIPTNIIQKIVLRGLKYLYVKVEDYNKLIDVLYSSQDKETMPDQIKADVNAVESVYAFIEDLGFDKKAIELTNKLHKNIEQIYTHKYMKKLLQRFRQMEGTFLYNHSYLTSIMAITVGKKFSWMNYENQEKIYLGCLLHDLGYKQKSNALREGMGKKEIAELSATEQEDILGHTDRFAKHLEKVGTIHPDVIKIVKFHHGVFQEESYPKQIYPAEINKIFALFILCHEMSLALYTINFNESKIEACLQEVCEKFDYAAYKSLIPAFQEAIRETFLDDLAA